MNSPPVSVGSLRGTPPRIRRGGCTRNRLDASAGCVTLEITVLVAPVRAADPALAARRSLRAQIARLEGELARVLTSTYPRIASPPTPAGRVKPRLLGLGELERVRDALAARVADVHRRADEQRAAQAAARE